MKKVAFILFALILITNIWVVPSDAQTDEAGIVSISVDEFRLDISRIWSIKKAGYEKPDEDVFLIFEITLHNDKSAETIFYGKDFPLHIDGDDFELQNMKEVRNEFYLGRDYPGFNNGQPVAANSSEPSLLVYDLPEGFSSVTLEFNPENSHSSLVLELTLKEDGEYLFNPLTPQEVVGFEIQVATLTPSPTATTTNTPTRAPTATTRPQTRYVTIETSEVRECPSIQCEILGQLEYGDSFTVIDWQVDANGNKWYSFDAFGLVAWVSDQHTSATNPVPTPTAHPRMQPKRRYVTAAKLNVRSCASTTCNIVTQLEYGDSFSAIVQDAAPDGSTWYGFEHAGNTVWVAGWLTSSQRPAPQAPSQPQSKPPVQAQPTPPPAPAYTCDCSKTCPQMSSCDEAYFQLNQCGCGRRDGDNDGVPCESICPGG